MYREKKTSDYLYGYGLITYYDNNITMEMAPVNHCCAAKIISHFTESEDEERIKYALIRCINFAIQDRADSIESNVIFNSTPYKVLCKLGFEEIYRIPSTKRHGSDLRKLILDLTTSSGAVKHILMGNGETL